MKLRRLIFITGIILITSTSFGQGGGLLGYIQERPAYEFPYASFTMEKQPDGFYSYTITAQKFKAMLRGVDSAWMKDYASKFTYSFFIKEKFYMLSYDTCKACESHNWNWKVGVPIKRGLYLFRLDDSGWAIASYMADKNGISKICPVQVDYFGLDESFQKPNEPQENYWSHSCYFPWRVAGDRPEDEREFGGAKNGSVNLSANGEVTIVLVNHWRNDKTTGYRIIFENKTIVLTPNTDGTYTVL